MTQLLRSKIIATQDMGGVADLLCPRCEGDHLHHLDVSVFSRPEDADAVTVTKLMNATASIAVENNRESGNPSSRRGGITIQFMCESCGSDNLDDLIELTIAQHKGSTEIGWRFRPRQDRVSN